MTTATPTTALVMIQPAFTDAERLALAVVGLDQRGVRALVLYPQPGEAVETRISRRVGDLWLLASAFDVQLARSAFRRPAVWRLS